MKKFTLIAAFVAMASITFGQVVGIQGPTKDEAKKSEIKTSVREDVIWEVTFDEAEPQYTIGHDIGDLEWVVDDTTSSAVTFENGVDFEQDDLPMGTIVTAPWLYMGRRDVGEYSESGGNFAYVDGITNLLQGVYNDVNTWVQFDSIDLSTVDNPKLMFTQNYKAFNSDVCYIDVSIDGGATWSENIQVNTEPTVNNYADDEFFIILTNYIANESNVSLRIRWQAPGDDQYSGGYGWQIDDVRIVDNPEVDMKLVDARMNFFEYLDYTDPANADYFHVSSHYGMIPAQQFESDYAVMLWNGIVENNGSLDNSADFNVTVLDPEGTEIYNETVTSPVLSLTEKDTVDLTTPEFTIDNPILGEYTVLYSLNIADDVNMDDNADTTYFEVTESVWARDMGNITTRVSPGTFSSGHVDGEKMGVDYFLLNSQTLSSLSVYIASNTTPGTAIVGHIYEFDPDISEYVESVATALVNITEDDIGGWIELPLPVDYPIEVDPEAGATVRAAVSFYYNGDDNDLAIGVDPTLPTSFWGAKWFMMSGSNADSWVSFSNWNDGGLAIRLNQLDENAVSELDAENLSVYPNPSNGVVRIDNVEGNDIEVFNLVGQRIYSVENAEQNVRINLNDQPQGTYIVRISGTNGTRTEKVNLIK
jgi:hypothetical protein